MKVLISIPTYKRIKKLERCLKSLSEQTHNDFDVVVHCDANDEETYNWIKDGNHKKIISNKVVIPVLSKERIYVIGAWNKCAREVATNRSFVGSYTFDALAWIVDDVELYPDCIEKTVEAMKINFPDYDGVVGIQQECPGSSDYKYKPFGQVLIGRKFIERYKDVNYQVCCHFYNHLHQDEEMWIFATSLNKFALGQGRLKHYHPGFIKTEMDETHPIVRGKVMREDREMFRQRQERGLVWGQTFESIEEYDNRKRKIKKT